MKISRYKYLLLFLLLVTVAIAKTVGNADERKRRDSVNCWPIQINPKHESLRALYWLEKPNTVRIALFNSAGGFVGYCDFLHLEIMEQDGSWTKVVDFGIKSFKQEVVSSVIEERQVLQLEHAVPEGFPNRNLVERRRVNIGNLRLK